MRSVASILQARGCLPIETTDPELLDRPLSGLADIEAIETTPLEDRLKIVDFSMRIDLALTARNPRDTGIFYVPDGDVGRVAEETTFQQLRANINRTAALLRSYGSGPSDVTAVLLPSVPSVYWAILGAMKAGIVFPPNWMLEPAHLLGLLKQARVRSIIALGPTPGFSIWESLSAIATELPKDIRIWSVAGPGGTPLPDSDLDVNIARQSEDDGSTTAFRSGAEIAAYVHSGGTTGMPKIVKLSHRNFSFRHWTLQLTQRLLPGERILHDTPMFHVGGLIGRNLPPLACGASILIPSVMGARDKRYIANYWKFVEKFRVTRLSAVPTTLAVLIKSPPQGEDLSSLEPNFVTGSTALPIPVRDEFERISGVRVLNSYGMTENTASIAIDPRDGGSREGSSGIRLPYTNVRVMQMDAQGRTLRPCGVDEIGMFQVSGAGLVAGFLNPEHARAARTDDGWQITGDLGRIDAEGYVFVTGRVKDVIIRGGHNIDPSLIEEPLMKSPDVLLAAAVGKPDAYAGELPVAYVQLSPGSLATSDSLLEFLAARITERAAMPKQIHILEKMPLTDVGKPMKDALRKDAAEREFLLLLCNATGLSSGDIGNDLSVSIRPHPIHGSMVHINLICPKDVGDRDVKSEITAQINKTMSQFSITHTVDWV